MADTDDPRRGIPATETLLNHPLLASFRDQIASEFLVRVIRSVVDLERQKVQDGRKPSGDEPLARQCAERVRSLLAPSLRRVINATGIILHTGLGRAPLSDEATAALRESAGYAALEFDLNSGERGDRQQHVEPLLCLLTGAEAALVVNNNAAALYLVLNALAYRREVIVSRGQLIEIGGSFRLPDIMSRSGVKLVEVGTTNRTRPSDYQAAITGRTGLLLRAHPSNYRIEGFTESVSISDLVALGRKAQIPVVDDLGSGVLWSWTAHGLPEEPTVVDSLRAGTDLVLVSGDKALGGPQAGIILGKQEMVTRLKNNPLARVLRPDKLILSALSASLRDFLVPDRVTTRNRVWHMLAVSPESLRGRAEYLKSRLAPLCDWVTLRVDESEAEAGSGTMPAETIPSVAMVCLPRGLTAARWSRKLRLVEIPVISTVKKDLVWLDLRTVAESEMEDLMVSISASLKHAGR